VTDDTRPASLQVADALRGQIASGTLAPGDKLPSIRSLAERFGMAPMTAQSAIDMLRSEGLIYTSPGRGTFVRADVKSSDVRSPSPEYLAISEHLSELDTQMREMADRVDKLEKLVERERQAPS
jgi:DNA-binding GntR family transcriptional regulator